MSLEKLIEIDEAYFVRLAGDLTDAITAIENTVEWNGYEKGGQMEDVRRNLSARSQEIYEIVIKRLKTK